MNSILGYLKKYLKEHFHFKLYVSIAIFLTLCIFFNYKYNFEDSILDSYTGSELKWLPHAELEATALQWAKEINSKSPTAQRMLKFSFNLIDDGLVGQQVFAGEATRLAYMTDEAEEGRNAFLEKRDPNWDAFPWQF